MKTKNEFYKILLRTLFLVALVALITRSVSCKKEELKSAQKDILSFTLPQQVDTAIIDEKNKTVNILVKLNTDLTKLAPTIVVSGKATINPASGATVDFSTIPVIYTVTAEDRSTQKWSVYVSLESDKRILSFTLSSQVSPAVINNSDSTVHIIVKLNTDLTKLAPAIVITPRCKISPDSGAVVDFSKGPVKYIVKGSDSTVRAWMVYVNLESVKNITSFSLSSQSSPATINNSASTVSLTCVAGTDLTKLSPVITVSSGCTISPASGAMVDFSGGPVKYTVTGSDSTTRNWLVTVSKILYTGNSILSATIPGQISSVLKGKIFTITVPGGTNLSSLTPSFVLSPGATISPDTTQPIDFSQDYVTFTVTSETKKTSTWNIIVTNPLIGASNSNIEYVGRIDFTNPSIPRYSAPGVYIRAKFTGTFCDADITDETPYNYIEVVVDNAAPVRIFADPTKTTFRLASGLSSGEHTILICKDTEAGVGALNFSGFRCGGLSTPDVLPTKKIECLGNSIACGAKMITSLCAQGTGSNWNITNRAYMAFGAIAARDLNAQWMLTSVSGIGLIHSYSSPDTLPGVYDRLYLDNSASPKWDFSKYIPDVVIIELGTNDGIQDSARFCSAYVSFIQSIRSHYSNAHIFCMSGPSVSDAVFNFMVKTLTSVVDHMNNALGDSKVHKVILSSHSLNGGCGGHPTADQQAQIASELETAIKPVLGWSKK